MGNCGQNVYLLEVCLASDQLGLINLFVRSNNPLKYKKGKIASIQPPKPYLGVIHLIYGYWYWTIGIVLIVFWDTAMKIIVGNNVIFHQINLLGCIDIYNPFT